MSWKAKVLKRFIFLILIDHACNCSWLNENRINYYKHLISYQVHVHIIQFSYILCSIINMSYLLAITYLTPSKAVNVLVHPFVNNDDFIPSSWVFSHCTYRILVANFLKTMIYLKRFFFNSLKTHNSNANFVWLYYIKIKSNYTIRPNGKTGFHLEPFYEYNHLSLLSVPL